MEELFRICNINPSTMTSQNAPRCDAEVTLNLTSLSINDMGTTNQSHFNYNNFYTPTIVENGYKSIEPLPVSHRINRISKRKININNLISIPISDANTYPPKSHGRHFVAAFLLSNVISLPPKMDEVRAVAQIICPDFISITETWLQSHIHANVVELNGYNLIRKDRQEGIHGGICIYIKDSIKVSLLDILSTSSLEVLWVNLRPTRLPRGIYSIIVGTVYHPPNADNTEMSKYLMETLSFIESNYINCGIIILSDFNRLNVKRLINHFNLKQIVKFPTHVLQDRLKITPDITNFMT